MQTISKALLVAAALSGCEIASSSPPVCRDVIFKPNWDQHSIQCPNGTQAVCEVGAPACVCRCPDSGATK